MMPWRLLAGWRLASAVTVGDYFDAFPSLDSDFAQDDLYGFGSGFRERRGAYDDYFGGPYSSYGGFGGFQDKKESGKDDCSRIEADGIPLADLLREASENLPDKISEAPDAFHKLVHFFSLEEQRNFLLGHCPQAVALSLLLRAELEACRASEAETVLRKAVGTLSEILHAAPSLRGPFKAPPVWTGKPWGDVLNAAQHRTGLLLFPVGEQQFHVDFVATGNWSIWANRRCRGRRDLGNLQGVPLETCLQKCSSHPSCRSATFWHWQPRGMGFDQRCFLSSSCAYELSTDEGAEGAFLFEKLTSLSPSEQEVVHARIRTANAEWAPRAGHQLVAVSEANGGYGLMLMGGIGVDAFNTTEEQPKVDSKEKKVGKGGKGAPKAKRRTNSTRLNVVQAYLSRHVELSGELPPLRSLPYGRLGDVWWSDDDGVSWKLLQQRSPWGPRAFFGAVAVKNCVLVLGGITTVEASGGAMGRKYVKDVWLASMPELRWHELPVALWEARAGFQALTWSRSDSEELLVLGGRLEDGELKHDVWALSVSGLERQFSSPSIWRLVTASADWSPRADFAATSAAERIWIFGGCGQDGRALADTWHSSDGFAWTQAESAAPWGPRVGASAVTLSWEADVMLLFGGYSYVDAGFGPTPPEASSYPAAWISSGGAWAALPPESLAWTQGTMHAASVAAPCNGTAVKGQLCSYVTGGVSNEGYYDNAVRRLFHEAVPAGGTTAREGAGKVAPAAPTAPDPPEFHVQAELAVGLAISSILAALWVSMRKVTADPATSHMRGAIRLLFGMIALLFALGGFTGTVLLRVSEELALLRADGPRCEIDANLSTALWQALGLAEAAARWDQFEILLRLASRESQFGYGFGYGGKGGDPYSRFDRGSTYETPGFKEPSRDLSLLPTIQSVSCRTPKCDRNETCHSTSRSLLTPYGCCSDYMLVMLTDITDWLRQEQIPYFITYGTLLGAVRQNDILPWTQDMDIVVDRAYWPKLQQGLEAAEFFGGRKYFFGVDQWEEKVSRVCADWEGFATSIIGGQENDRFSRPTDFHLDVYASDWWQITDLHLVDCVEPLGTQLEIRGRNFSAPGRPRACVEKLYGSEWRIPKQALAGVN